MGLLTSVGNLLRKIPVPIWVLVLAPVIGIAGSEAQKFLDARAYPEINKQRIQILEGKWEGYGIQPITETESQNRLKARQVRVVDKLPKDLQDAINDCTFRNSTEAPSSLIWFPAHLALTVERTSFFSKKSLRGTLEITPNYTKYTHLSQMYLVTGRLEQNGDYIRLDYSNADPSQKDFGTLLLEYNSEGKLCGQFISYGPISRGIVNGKYIFSTRVR